MIAFIYLGAIWCISIRLLTLLVGACSRGAHRRMFWQEQTIPMPDVPCGAAPTAIQEYIINTSICSVSIKNGTSGICLYCMHSECIMNCMCCHWWYEMYGIHCMYYVSYVLHLVNACIACVVGNHCMHCMYCMYIVCIHTCMTTWSPNGSVVTK